MHSTFVNRFDDIGKSLAKQFQITQRLKTFRSWLKQADECKQHDLMLLLLIVLKELPVQREYLETAKLVETLRKLKSSTSQESRVKLKISELIKFWKSSLLEEKEKKRSKPQDSVNVKALKRMKTATDAPPTEDKAEAKDRKIAHAASKGPGKGGETTSAATKKDVLGNLLSSSLVTKKVSKKIPSTSVASSVPSTLKSSPSISSPSKVELPVIHRFGLGSANSAVTSKSRKLKWADEVSNGKLEHVKLIESRHEMNEAAAAEAGSTAESTTTKSHGGASFDEARKNERQREMSLAKESMLRRIVPTIPWTAPHRVAFPSSIPPAIFATVVTAETKLQQQRTKDMMQLFILPNEVPPQSAEPWHCTPEEARRNREADEIPLSLKPQQHEQPPGSVSAPPPAFPLSAHALARASPVLSQDERALLDSLPPAFLDLRQDILSTLLQNPHIFPLVYEAAQQGMLTNEQILDILHQEGGGGGPPQHYRQQQQQQQPSSGSSSYHHTTSTHSRRSSSDKDCFTYHNTPNERNSSSTVGHKSRRRGKH